jgi:O-antigen/teichoic acid export membrane protein
MTGASLGVPAPPSTETGTAARHAGAITVGASGLSLLANFATGVLVARVLGPAGRGESTAVITSTQVFAWVFLVGSVQTISYYRARDPDNAGVLLGTWLVLLVPLSVGALLLGELLLPVVMSAQSHHTIAIARLFMPTVALVLLTELVAGYIVGSKRFVMFNLLRALTPMTVGLVYVVLWRTGALSVATVVWSFAGVQVLAVVWALGRCVGWDAVSRPNLKLARQTVWYGIRAHTTNISTLLTARLDLLIMPAFLSASSVGLYSVATNVSWIVFAQV